MYLLCFCRFNQQLKARCQIVFDYVYIRWSQLEASGELQHGQCSMHPRTQLNQMCWKVVNDTINDTIGADNIAKLSRKETKKIKDVFNTLGNEKLGPRDTTRTSRTEESVPAAGGDTLPHIRKRKRPDVLSPSSKSTRNPSKLRKPSRKKKRDQYEQFVHEWYDKKILEEEKLFVSKNMCNLDESNGLREEHERRFPGEKLAPSPGDIFDLGNQVATESQDYSGSRPACNLEQSVFEDLINQYLAGLLPDHRVESVTGFGNSLRTKKPMSQGEATLLYPGKHMYSLHAPLTHEKGGDCVVTLLQHNKDARKDLVISPVCGAGQFAHYANSPSPRGNDYKNANCVPVVVSLYAKDPSDNKRKYITALFLVCIKRITAGGHLIW